MKRYFCDRCQDVDGIDKPISLREYLFNWAPGRGRCCDFCWRYIHLARGECKSCNSKTTLRTSNKTPKTICSCGSTIILRR